MNKKFIGIAVAVAVVALAGFMMMGGDGAKPEESFEQIKAAAVKKDAAGVEKYVDFDALAGSIAKADFVLGANADNPELAPLKADFVAHTAKAFRAIATSGNLNEGAGSGDPLSDVLYDIQNNTGFRSWSYVGASAGKVDGDKAIVPVKVMDKALDKEYTLDVDMTKENGVWRVKGIGNLNALAAQRRQDVEAKLAELNKDVQDKISKSVSIGNANMALFADNSGWGLFNGGKKVKVSLTLTNTSDKVVTQLSGYAELYKDGAKKPTLNYKIALPYKKKINPGQKLVISKNHSVSSEDGTSVDSIIKGFDGYKQIFTITSVKFADGSALEPLRSLPLK